MATKKKTKKQAQYMVEWRWAGTWCGDRPFPELALARKYAREEFERSGVAHRVLRFEVVEVLS